MKKLTLFLTLSLLTLIGTSTVVKAQSGETQESNPDTSEIVADGTDDVTDDGTDDECKEGEECESEDYQQ